MSSIGSHRDPSNMAVDRDVDEVVKAVVSPLIDTFACIPTWKLRIKLTSFDGTPLFSSNLHVRSRSTESKILTRSMKTRCKSCLCSLHFCCRCLKTNIVSNVDRPKHNPLWVSGGSFSVRGFRRLSTTQQLGPTETHPI